MAGFKIHLTAGMASGAALSLIGYSVKGVGLLQAGAIFVVGSAAGLLPDLDSDTGKPLSFLFHLVSILVPSLLFMEIIREFDNSAEFVVCYFTLSYLLLNYGVCAVIKRLTVHRGILHSVPFALVCGGIGYLLFESSGSDIALLAGIAVLTGCLVHLLVDEISSFDLKLGLLPFPRRSRGTAFKLKSDSIVATIFIYLVLVLVGVAILVPNLSSYFLP
ncbi:MAG: metal-dependent hydrolase [Deltaproteobacteria bacterium]|nr:metal-dependent hydrolase [Deltaproteobacteria bacterium]